MSQKAHLKVVGGTEFVAAAGEIKPARSAPEAMAASTAASAVGDEIARDYARALIRGYVVEGQKTVGDLLDEINDRHLRGSPADGAEHLRRNAEIRALLRLVGVWTVNADPEMDLDVVMYGVPGDTRKLIKFIPKLKKYEAALIDLTF